MDHLLRSRIPNRTQAAPLWFQLQADSRARFRLFCFPYAGGSSGIYRSWTKLIHPDIQVVPALLPGREFRLREPSFTNLDSMVEAFTREIFPYLDRPFAFFGHSMGAMLSFELARRLRSERGIETEHLFLAARRAPQIPERDPQIDNLPEPEFIAEIERLNGTPREVLEHRELMELLIPMLRADFAVCHNYDFVPGDPLKCSITVFGGTTDDTGPEEKLEGWCAHTTGRCRIHMLEGDHFFINQQQEAIVRIITETLVGHS